MIFNMIAQGNGRSAFVEALSVSANGVYSAPEGLDGYNPVTVEVQGGGGEAFDELVMRTISEAGGNVSYIGDYAFYRCTSLTTASFPMVTSIGFSAFMNCSRLTTASFPAATFVGSYAFYKCYNLLSLYLLGSSITSLENASTFKSTPISDYTTSTGGVHGSIFVPASLYDSYLTTTNWSLYSSRFVSV